MATIAIDLDLSHLPRAEDKPRRRRGENKGRFVTKAVRRRNQRGANQRWQPGRAFKKFRKPRSVQIAEAIADSIVEDELVIEEPVIGYSQCALEHEMERTRDSEDEIFIEAVEHGRLEQRRAARLAGCRQYFDDEVAELTSEPEVLSLSTATMLGEIEKTTLAHLAA